MERTGRTEEIDGYLPKPAPHPNPLPPWGRGSPSRPHDGNPILHGGEDKGEGVAR
jgi:hypothetical protein